MRPAEALREPASLSPAIEAFDAVASLFDTRFVG